VFFALVLSKRADVLNFENLKLTQWKPHGQSKYQIELDFIKYNPNNSDLIAFEKRLKDDNDNLTYMCYKYIFKDRLTWAETAERLDIDAPFKLAPIVEKIAFGLRISCKL
jgi:hypothetical protein